ncbi:MAG TPA: hypothetical protein ENJ46_06035 [Hellea balneolensis]|uniref:Uncharacterized protein n=1 Tax=Hellea balneolensis TaxID=287478 RepID=A0A7C3C3Y7_9PROT|nr:hypothetical protein [Hellea balneolensis]
MDAVANFMTEMKNGPAWVFYWVNFMGLLFMLSIPFSFKRVEARWIALATLVLAPVIMAIIYSKFGYQRILGLGHVLGWSPIMYYLWKRKDQWRVGETLSGKWIALTFAVMCISMVMDVSDVVRFMMGARG